MSKFLTGINKVKLAIGTAAVGLLGSSVSFAAGGDIDVSAGQAAISSGTVAVAAIGGAMVGLAIIMAVYRKLQKQ